MSAVRNQHKRSDEASLDSLSSGAELEPDESVGSNENLRHPVQQRPPDRPAQPGSIEAASTSQSSSVKPQVSPSAITQEKLERGASLKPGEFQVLYQSPDTDAFNQDRLMKDHLARQVAPGKRQSPIAILSINPSYEMQTKPLIIEYPAKVENLRLNNTGFSWEVKLPSQASMSSALYGAQLTKNTRFRLDQFHCHWGVDEYEGSEHTVDNRSYSAELHFVHYNMEKYHTVSKAARHTDGLVVLGVFLDAQEGYRNHAELEKIVAHLKSIQLKGEHAILRQALRLENLLPSNRSYWSYQGSLTTLPFFESVTWFVFKQPIKCSKSQLDRFRSIKSSLKHYYSNVSTSSREQLDEDSIKSNRRKTQPLNGRTVLTYDEPM